MNLLVVLRYHAVAVGFQQHLQVLHMGLVLRATVGVSDLGLALQGLEDHGIAVDIVVEGDGVLLAVEGL